MNWMCTLLVWSGSRFNFGFTSKSRQGRCMERSPNSCSASSQRTPRPNSTTKQSPELFWVWPFLPHQLSNRFRFKVSLTDPFISWKASMLFSRKLSKVLVPCVTSPIHQVLYLSPQLPESCENLVPKPHTHRQSKQPPDGRESLKPGLWELGMGIQPLSRSPTPRVY